MFILSGSKSKCRGSGSISMCSVGCAEGVLLGADMAVETGIDMTSILVIIVVVLYVLTNKDETKYRCVFYINKVFIINDSLCFIFLTIGGNRGNLSV